MSAQAKERIAVLKADTVGLGKGSAAEAKSSAKKADGVQPRTRDRERTHRALRSALDEMKSAGFKVSVVAVAESVGVHPSLVHKVYPDISSEIAELRRQGRPSTQERQEGRLAKAIRDLDEFREKLRVSEDSIRTLISKNRTLESRIKDLEAGLISGTAKIVPMKARAKAKRI